MEQTGYHVVLEPDPEGGYIAVVPAFPGCHRQGENADEALSNAREAILLLGVRSKPDELSAESDPLGWKGEGWS